MKSENNLKFSINEKLNDLDTENQTYGCRAYNPENCKYCYSDKLCAFVRQDHICKMPSRKWKNIYKELLNSKI